MIVVSYLVSVIVFYIVYMISTVLFGSIGLLIKRALTNPDVELNGLLLTFTAYVSTYLSFFSVFFVFSWFNCEPNWFIITPIMIALWFYFSPALYNRHFNSGAAHWGMLLSIIIFLSSL